MMEKLMFFGKHSKRGWENQKMHFDLPSMMDNSHSGLLSELKIPFSDKEIDDVVK